MPPALIGLSRDFKNLSEWMDDALAPAKKEFFWKSATQCYDSNWDDYAGMTLEPFFKKGQKALDDAIPRSVFDATCKIKALCNEFETKHRSSNGNTWNSKGADVYL